MTALPHASASRWRRALDALYATGGQLAAVCVLAILALMVYASVGRTLDWRVAAFDIRRPAWSDIAVATGRPTDSCSDSAPCLRQADGTARHRGLEAEAEWRNGDMSCAMGYAEQIQATDWRAAALAWLRRRIK